MAAAKALGISFQGISESISKAKAKAAEAARLGNAPGHFNSGTAPGYLMGKVTVQRAKDGGVERTWERQSPDAQQAEAAIREMIEGLCEGIKGQSPFVPPPELSDADLLAVYQIGDHHHGMYADADETGSNYDCAISATLLEGAIDHLATIAPPAENALLINLGDFYHGNDGTNETPGHHNRLDVDTRYGKVMHSGGLALVGCVLRLLKKHKHVTVWNMRGNHDPDAAFALALAMSFYFHAEPRVTVDMGPSLYKYHRFGKNLIASHHGHGAKGADLPLLMATDRQADWGETEFRVWHCGHIHHKTAKEFPGCTVETHRTLAASDAWHAGKGYRSKRDMNAIIYHRSFGEVQRSRFDLGMLG